MDDPFVERLRRALAPDFEVERPLGAGGMGIVLLAREISLGRQVAIKTIKPEFATAVAVERFLREAQTLASLSHPNIVPIFALQQRDGIPCIVMEYLEGETLRSRIERGPIPPEEARRILRDVLAALDAAHGRGVVHRDVKPENIFLRPDRAVLTDFGIAKPVAARGEALTVEGQTVGTPAYMPPECFAGDSRPASDIYAVGMVLYEALTGRHWIQELVDPAAGDWAGVPRDLVPPLQRALAFAPDGRWGDAAAFRRALKPRRTRPWQSAVIVAAAAIVVAVVWWPPGPPSPVIADVALGPFRPADPGVRLRQGAFDVLDNAEGLTLAPLRDDLANGANAPPTKNHVTGAVTVVDDRVHVALQIGGQQRVVPGEPGEFEWELGRRIALAILEVVKPDAFLAPACKPQSVESYNAYMRGQQAFRRDDWGAAIGFLEEAVSRDPEYCLAVVRLWLVQKWSRIPTTVNLARLLDQHGGNLSRADSLMIAAELAPTRAQRWALYARAMKEDLFEAVAPVQYGADLTHRGPLDGIPLDSGVVILREARDREPQLAEIHDQLMWALVRLGYRDSAAAALRALKANAREARDVDPSVFDLIWQMRFLPSDSVLPSLFAAGQGAQAQIAQRVRLALSFDLAPYQALIGAELATRADAPVGMRAHARIARGLGLLALGQPGAGLAELDSAVAMRVPGLGTLALQAAQWRVLAPALRIPGVAAEEATAARATLEGLLADSAIGARAAWTLALDALQQGDSTRARTLALRAPPRLREILDAITIGTGAPRKALERTAGLRGVGEEQNRLGEPFARAILHLRRAEWYDALGDHDRAERERRWHENSDFEGWLKGPIQSAEVDWVAGAYVRVSEGMRRVDAGDLTACADLRRVVDTLWTHVEPEVARLRDEGHAKASRCP